METNQLEQLHEIELDLLKSFVSTCERHNIRYYVIGGTLLGAVRNGGFIPWDDDIDVAVPRDDYRRLVRLMRGMKDEVIGIQYYKDDHDLYFYPLKIVNKHYRIRDPRAAGGYSNPWIDVLPIDGMPGGFMHSVIFRIRMEYYRLLLVFCYIDRLRDIDRSLPQRVVINVAKIFRPGRWIDPTKVKDKVDRLLSSNRIEDCKIIGTCMGAYFFHEFVPKEYFGSGTQIKFCDMEVNAPEQIDPYLKHMYGDYMTPPPEGNRKAVHIVLDNQD